MISTIKSKIYYFANSRAGSHSKIPCENWPLSALAVVSWLVGSSLWLQIVSGPLSLAVYNIIYLFVILAVLVFEGNGHRVKTVFWGTGFTRLATGDFLLLLSVTVISRLIWLSLADYRTPAILDNLDQFFSDHFFAPILEEFVWRGVILGTVLNSTEKKMASILVVSLWFASAHNGWLQSGLYFSAYFGQGLLYCLSYYQLRSVIPGIILHGIWNAMSLLEF